jgi:HlyD family secretion protein
MLIATLFIWGPALIRPSISRSRIRTARVDLGPIEATITASGTIVPEFEQVLSSPINTRVVKVLKSPGAALLKGDAILELDISESILALEKMNQQIELKQNQQSKAKLDLENTLIDLQGKGEIKELEFKSLKSIHARNQGLRKQGLLSEDQLQQSELDEEKARVELKQLEATKKNAQQSTNTQLEGLALELKTLQKERDEAQRQLDLATTRSDRNGVLTWVVSEEGASVQKGAVLARIADLNSFRVEATVSDIHASRLSIGLPVSVKINESYLEGAVTSILPTVKNGAITLVINLKEKSNLLLRSNLRVDVLIVTERKERALRIKRGPFASSEGVHNVFVIRDNTAIKVPVRIGISNFDSYEVLEGLLEGDEAIISDMSDFIHLKEVKLK